MQIGSFHQAGDGFVGRLQTLTLDVPLRLVPVPDHGSDKAPDWRIHLDDVAHGAAVGSGWTRRPDGRPHFIMVQLDCPGLTRPLRASLRRTADHPDRHVLVWARQKVD